MTTTRRWRWCARRTLWRAGCCVWWLVPAAALAGADQPEPVQLPPVSVSSPRVALQNPTESYAMPITALRFEPLVDVEARGGAESQADVTIQGGTFLNTGFRIGGLPLFDPQTGHYNAGIPVAPELLSGPQVLTGVNNAIDGFNADVGTVDYEWKRIESRGQLTAAAGQYHTYNLSLYEGTINPVPVAGQTLGTDAEVSRSISHGSVPFGDHRFQRYNFRLQLAGGSAQTDLFYGYQSTLFGWPNMYTPFKSELSEIL